MEEHPSQKNFIFVFFSGEKCAKENGKTKNLP